MDVEDRALLAILVFCGGLVWLMLAGRAFVIHPIVGIVFVIASGATAWWCTAPLRAKKAKLRESAVPNEKRSPVKVPTSVTNFLRKK